MLLLPSRRVCVAVCCSVLQYVAVWCSVFQCVLVCCSVLQCVAVCCRLIRRFSHVALQFVAVCCVAVCCSCSVLQLQCVADSPDASQKECCYAATVLTSCVCCSVLHRVAVCCSVLQRVEVDRKNPPPPGGFSFYYVP